MNTITLKGIIDEDFVNYKVPSMSLIFPYCDFKCGKQFCQNISLSKEKNIEINIDSLCERYLNNPITGAIVCQGLEPLNSFLELYNFIETLREVYRCYHPVVIYTGFNETEIELPIKLLKEFENIIVKFGRYMPDNDPHFDEILGVTLVSNNQYAKRIS